MTDILIVGVDNDLGVSDGIFLCLVDTGVQGRHVDVFDLFVFTVDVMQFDGIGAAPEEGIPGLKWINVFEGVKEVTGATENKRGFLKPVLPRGIGMRDIKRHFSFCNKEL